MRPVVLTVQEPVADLDGETFQLHVLPGGRVRLSPVTVAPLYLAPCCPVVVGGERCGLPWGHEGEHEGKHQWSNGD